MIAADCERLNYEFTKARHCRGQSCRAGGALVPVGLLGSFLLLMLIHLVAHGTAGSGTEDGMVVSHMTGNGADGRA